MQYKVLSAGSGKHHPAADSRCQCHYEGRTAGCYPDGKKFDSSYDRGAPTIFAPNEVCRCLKPPDGACDRPLLVELWVALARAR